MKRLLYILVLLITTNGCATINFSANYYTPPENYQIEVRKLWNELLIKLPLKYSYNMSIVSDNGCKGMKGVPEIESGNVRLPDNFVKYVYQNYYDDRFKIMTCIIAHELCHSEYNIGMESPEVHVQVDARAGELLERNTDISPQDFYSSLFVLRNYWIARKGVVGHLSNIGWNAISLVSLLYGGSYYFVDWFATDLDKRMAAIYRAGKETGVIEHRCFKRYYEDGRRSDNANKINNTSNQDSRYYLKPGSPGYCELLHCALCKQCGKEFKFSTEMWDKQQQVKCSHCGHEQNLKEARERYLNRSIDSEVEKEIEKIFNKEVWNSSSSESLLGTEKTEASKDTKIPIVKNLSNPSYEKWGCLKMGMQAFEVSRLLGKPENISRLFGGKHEIWNYPNNGEVMFEIKETGTLVSSWREPQKAK